MPETLQSTISEIGVNQGDLIRFMKNVRDLVNDIQAKLIGNYVLGVPALAIGSTTTAVATAAFDFQIAGKQYTKAAVTAGTAPGNDVVPQALYGAVALEIGTDGTLDAIEATANATGYATAALAVAGLPAIQAAHARVGWVTATKSDGAFTFGTTALNAANSTVAYTDAATLANSIITTALTLSKG